MTTTIYGIANCDKVRGALAWLEEHALAYRFHDFRRDGVTRQLLDLWCEETEWALLLNRRSTTWRKLPPDATALDRDGATALMLDHPTLIRRPLLRHNGSLIVGFDVARYSALFSL